VPADSPPAAAELLRSADWEKLGVRLARYAFARTGRRSWQDAEDVAQLAIAQAFDPAYKRWDPTAEPDLFRYLGSLVNGIVSNLRQSHAETRVRPHDHDQLARVAPAVPSPEAEVERGERAERTVQRLRARAAADARVLEVLGFLESGIDTTREHAERLGCTMEEARSARRRLATHLAAVERELDAENHDA